MKSSWTHKLIDLMYGDFCDKVYVFQIQLLYPCIITAIVTPVGPHVIH